MNIQHIPEYFITSPDTNVIQYKIINNNKTILNIDMRFIALISKPSFSKNLKYTPTLCHLFLSSIPPNSSIEINSDNKIKDILFLENDFTYNKHLKLQWEHTDFMHSSPNHSITIQNKNSTNEIMSSIIPCTFSGYSNGIFITSPNNNLITQFKLTLNNKIIQWENQENFFSKINDNLWYLPFNDENIWSKNTSNAVNFDEIFKILVNYKSFMSIYNQVRIYSLELENT